MEERTKAPEDVRAGMGRRAGEGVAGRGEPGL